MENNLRFLSPISTIPYNYLDKQIVFISENAVLGRNEKSAQFKYSVLPEIWNDARRLDDANIYLEQVYLRLEKKIAGALNKAHNLDYSEDFWKIPLASWLLHYLHILYDRFSRLNLAVESYGKDNLVLLVCHVPVILPGNHNEFIERFCVQENDLSAFYGIIAEKMGIRTAYFEAKALKNGSRTVPGTKLNFFSRQLYSKLLKKISGILLDTGIWGKQGIGNVLLMSNDFMPGEKIYLAKNLQASFFPNEFLKVRGSVHFDRSKLGDIPFEDDFEKIAIKLLPRLMPEYLLEKFVSFRQKAKKWSGYKIFFSSTGWYSSMTFCYAAALGKLNGAKIVACQHGGGYGQYKKSPVEFIERRLSDYFITWGWQDANYKGAECVPLAQPNLSRFLNTHRRNKTTQALWSSISLPKQAHRLYSFNFNLACYLEQKKLFLSILNSDIRKALIYRPYHSGYGWEYEKSLLSAYPEVRLEYLGTLTEALKTIKLYICDHMGTSFMEAFVINTPTIIFWHPGLGDERACSAVAFDLLRKAGILYHDPIEAAKKINSIWHDVEGWWALPQVQQAKNAFCRQFARTSKTYLKDWELFFKQILNKERKGTS